MESMTLLDGIKQFHQLDKQFGSLLERLNTIQQQYQGKAIPHTTLRLIGEELVSYIAIVDSEIDNNRKKSNTVDDLNNPAISADLQLLIQRLTLTKQQLQQYADHFSGLMIEMPEIFEHHYSSLQEIIDDELITSKTKELVLLYVDQKKQLPFVLDLDDTVEQQMESAENHIVLHHEYLLSMTNRFEKIISQLSTITDLTQHSYHNLRKGYQSPRQDSYVIKTINIDDTDFQKHFENFVGHTNDLIEDLLHINRLGDQLTQLSTYQFGSGKALQSAFFELCNSEKSFGQIVIDIQAYNQQHRIDYLVQLYQSGQQLRDASYEQQYIGRECVENIVTTPHTQDWLPIINSIVKGYHHLIDMNTQSLSMIDTRGRQDKTKTSYQQLIKTHYSLLSTQRKLLIQHINNRTLYTGDYTDIHTSSDYLQQSLSYLQQAQGIIDQAKDLIRRFESVSRDHLHHIIKAVTQKHRSTQIQQLSQKGDVLSHHSIDDQRHIDFLTTTRSYYEIIKQQSLSFVIEGEQLVLFQEEISIINKQLKQIDRYTYSYLDSLKTIKKQYTPTLTHRQLSMLLPTLERYIEKTYNTAYDSYQASQRSSSYSSNISFGNSSRSSSSSSSSWSSGSSSSSRSGSSGGWSSSGGGSW